LAIETTTARHLWNQADSRQRGQWNRNPNGNPNTNPNPNPNTNRSPEKKTKQEAEKHPGQVRAMSRSIYTQRQPLVGQQFMRF